MPQKKPKILYIITKGQQGGAQRYILDLTSNLKDSWDITLAHGEGDALAQELNNYGVKTVQIKGLGRDVKIFKDLVALKNIYRLIKEIRPDVLHLNSSKAAGLGSIAGQFAGVKKIIITVHGFPFREDRHPISTAIIKALSWVSVCLATDVIFVCRLDKELAEKWIFKPKLHLVHNGIKDIFYQPKGAARKILEEYGVEPDFWIRHKYSIGTIAELHKNKGLSYALTALKNLPETGYIVIGEGEERSKLEQEIKTLDLESQVRLVGFVKNAANLLRAFDFFILPSVKEGLPYVLLEASLAGVPIIATDTGGISEIIGKKHLIQPKNPILLADKIREFSKNKALAPEFAQETEKNARENFILEKMIKLTDAVYKN